MGTIVCRKVSSEYWQCTSTAGEGLPLISVLCVPSLLCNRLGIIGQAPLKTTRAIFWTCFYHREESAIRRGAALLSAKACPSTEPAVFQEVLESLQMASLPCVWMELELQMTPTDRNMVTSHPMTAAEYGSVPDSLGCRPVLVNTKNRTPRCVMHPSAPAML